MHAHADEIQSPTTWLIDKDDVNGRLHKRELIAYLSWKSTRDQFSQDFVEMCFCNR